MSLSSLQLDAFVEVARTGSFSAAAGRLKVTQSALSQRILNLEGELGTAVFVRDRKGARLTAVGEELFGYCRARDQLEGELVARLRSGGARRTLAGTIRIGAYSSVGRSLVLPALAGIVRANPEVQVHLLVRETRELPDLLRSGEADLVLHDAPSAREKVVSKLLGHERLVLVESARAGARKGVFLDHDPDDETTRRFLRAAARAAGSGAGGIRRSFLGDIYGVLEGVRLGMGSAVLPLHLLEDRRGLRVVESAGTVKFPVWLLRPETSHSARLADTVAARLAESISRRLARG